MRNKYIISPVTILVIRAINHRENHKFRMMSHKDFMCYCHNAEKRYLDKLKHLGYIRIPVSTAQYEK